MTQLLEHTEATEIKIVRSQYDHGGFRPGIKELVLQLTGLLATCNCVIRAVSLQSSER